MKFRDSNIYRVCLPRVRHAAASLFVSLLNPLIQRLQHARIYGGDDIHSCIEFFFRHSRFPCVRKAALHSRIAEPHHCHGETDEHLLAFGEALDGMGVAVKSSKISFLQGLAPCLTSLESQA